MAKNEILVNILQEYRVFPDRLFEDPTSYWADFFDVSEPRKLVPLQSIDSFHKGRILYEEDLAEGILKGVVELAKLDKKSKTDRSDFLVRLDSRLDLSGDISPVEIREGSIKTYEAVKLNVLRLIAKRFHEKYQAYLKK